MTITLIFLAIIMATVIFWLLKQTFNVQPWVSDEVADEVSGVSLDLKPQAIALSTFMAVATSLFALFDTLSSILLLTLGPISTLCSFLSLT